MIKKSTTFISMCLLLLWSVAQGIDAWHHMHEQHEEEVCKVDDAHYCTPHFEVELCGLCTVVHGNAIQQVVIENENNFELSVVIRTKIITRETSSYCATQSSRGPPA